MEPSADLDAALFADHLVPVVLLLALAMQWLLHQVTARIPRFPILLPGIVTSVIWACAGWMIGGVGGVLTFALGTAASLGLAMLDARMRRVADDEDQHSRLSFG